MIPFILHSEKGKTISAEKQSLLPAGGRVSHRLQRGSMREFGDLQNIVYDTMVVDM